MDRMVSEEYAFMASSQAMYILASRYSFRYIFIMSVDCSNYLLTRVR